VVVMAVVIKVWVWGVKWIGNDFEWIVMGNCRFGWLSEDGAVCCGDIGIDGEIDAVVVGWAGWFGFEGLVNCREEKRGIDMVGRCSRVVVKWWIGVRKQLKS
jgi:hypothetical protein